MNLPINHSFQRIAWVLSIAGLAPFALPSLYLLLRLMGVAFTQHSDLFALSIDATALYAAIILSFLGGIRWGLALVREDEPQILIMSVVPSLVGWASFLLPMPMQLLLLAAAFAAQWRWDYRATTLGAIAPWFGKLRTIISACVIVSLALSFVMIL